MSDSKWIIIACTTFLMIGWSVSEWASISYRNMSRHQSDGEELMPLVSAGKLLSASIIPLLYGACIIVLVGAL